MNQTIENQRYRYQEKTLKVQGNLVLPGLVSLSFEQSRVTSHPFPGPSPLRGRKNAQGLMFYCVPKWLLKQQYFEFTSLYFLKEETSL